MTQACCVLWGKQAMEIADKAQAAAHKDSGRRLSTDKGNGAAPAPPPPAAASPAASPPVKPAAASSSVDAATAALDALKPHLESRGADIMRGVQAIRSCYRRATAAYLNQCESSLYIAEDGVSTVDGIVSAHAVARSIRDMDLAMQAVPSIQAELHKRMSEVRPLPFWPRIALWAGIACGSGIAV